MSSKMAGIALAVLAGAFWGIMAVSVQYLISRCGFSSEGLVSIRLAGSGLLMLAIERCARRHPVLPALRAPRDVRDILLYAAGLLVGQYTFFLSIEYANAATATILVGTVPIFLLLWVTLRHGRRPMPHELACIALAFTGVALLVTKGDLSALDLSALGVFWGLVSAAAAAYNTIEPRAVIDRVGVGPVIGWAMLAAGLAMGVAVPPWRAPGDWTAVAALNFFLVVAVGTVGAFWCYLESTRRIPATICGVLTSFEPLTAVLLAVCLLGTEFGAWEAVGAAAVLANMVILGLVRKRI